MRQLIRSVGMPKINSISSIGPSVIGANTLSQGKKRQKIDLDSTGYGHHSSTLHDIIKDLDQLDMKAINQEKIDKIKAALAEGKYEVNTDNLADNLLNEFF